MGLMVELLIGKKLTDLAEKAKALKLGNSTDENLSNFLTKREVWAKRAKETTKFQSVVIKDNMATVTTLDRGTLGKLETSIYTLYKINGKWKLQQEKSLQKEE